MPVYRHPEATGRPDEITVIEDPDMVERDASGALHPSFAFIDPLTVRAHPAIMDSLVEKSERLYEMSIGVLTALPDPPPSLTASQYLFLGLLHRRMHHNDKAAASFAPSFLLAETISFASILWSSKNLDARVQDVQPLRW